MMPPGNGILRNGVTQDARRGGKIGVPGFHESELRIGFPAISDAYQVLAQRVNNLFPPAVHDILPKFLEGDVDDVVVMEFLGRDFVAEFEPDAVEQIDFFVG